MKRCSKVTYNSFDEAHEALEDVRRTQIYGEMLVIYRCQHCGKLHLGGMSYAYYRSKYKVHSRQGFGR